MVLEAGTRLGHYEVVSSLGAGGMGEVYRARDTKLGREVALKLLLEEVSQDSERMARFEREARVLASLNHNNIATLYGFESEGEKQFLVMELVEGETLAERIKRGAIPVEEALPLFLQIAEGLEAAHESGVIHRDLKPANIKITDDGHVKILDFGLAKATAAETEPSPDVASSQSPTLTLAATRRGEILGTAAYMSPEQARGLAVDKRADVWAFGVCLFEALTGERSFEGRDATDTLAAVLRDDADWDALPAATPTALVRLLRRCLQRELHERLRDIGDARLDLQEAMSGAAPEGAGVDGGSGPTRSAFRWWTAVVAAAAAGVAAWGWLRPTPVLPPPPAVRMVVETPPGESFPLGFPALSPDGRLLLYGTVDETGQRRSYLRPLDSFLATPLYSGAGSRADLALFEGAGAFFSPDGEWIGFFSDGQLLKLRVHSEQHPELIAPASDIATGGSWGEDGTVVFSSDLGRGLLRVSSSGGTPEVLTTPDLAAGEIGHAFPDLLPGQQAVLYGLLTVDGWSLAVQQLETGEQRILVPGATIGRYLPSGHLVYGKGDGIFVVRFDADSLTTMGAPVLIVDGLPTRMWANGVYTLFALSDTGTLAYIAGESDPSSQLILVDRDGSITPLGDHSAQAPRSPRFAPDGDLVAVDDAGAIWLHDLSRGGTRSRFTSGAPRYSPVWTPDGSRIALASYESGPANLHWISASDPSDSESLLEGENRAYPSSFSPDGELLAYIEVDPETLSDIWVLRINGDRTPEPVVRTEFNEYQPRFSPDGHWLAYASEKTGRFEVYVQGYPRAGRPVLLSSDGGTNPVWRGDGSELFYRSANRIMVVSVSPEEDVHFGPPRTLVEPPFNAFASNAQNFDVSADGQRFVVIAAAEESTPRQLRLVLNWSAEPGALPLDD